MQAYSQSPTQPTYFVDISGHELRLADSSAEISSFLESFKNNLFFCEVSQTHFIEVSFSSLLELKDHFENIQSVLHLSTKTVIYSGVGFDIYAELKDLVSSINGGHSIFISARKSTVAGLCLSFESQKNCFQQIKKTNEGSFQAIRKSEPQTETQSSLEFPLCIIDIRIRAVMYTLSQIKSGDLQPEKELFETMLGEENIIEILRHFRRSFQTTADFRKQVKDGVVNGIIENADITVGDIYGESCSFLPVDIIASSLGKADSNTSLDDFILSNTIIIQSNIANLYCKIVV